MLAAFFIALPYLVLYQRVLTYIDAESAIFATLHLVDEGSRAGGLSQRQSLRRAFLYAGFPAMVLIDVLLFLEPLGLLGPIDRPYCLRQRPDGDMLQPRWQLPLPDIFRHFLLQYKKTRTFAELALESVPQLGQPVFPEGLPIGGVLLELVGACWLVPEFAGTDIKLSNNFAE